MRKIMVITSVVIASLIILTSFSSVADARLIENRISQHRFGRISGFQQLKCMLDSTERNLANRIVLMIDDCMIDSNTSKINLSMGLISTLMVTILAEFCVYVDFFSDNENLRRVGTLFFMSVIINTITNPALNIVYRLGYHDIEMLEHIVTVVESYMIFVLFNIVLLDISFEDASDLSLYANTYSYNLCKYINSLI